MTIDPTTFNEVNSLVQAEPKALYPVRIPEQHNQLKHFIATTDKDIVYFASEYEVHALHIPTSRRERIATLGFKIYCLAAGQGWLCAGGPTGQCAFINEGRSISDGNATGVPGSTEVDTPLPLSLDPEARFSPQDTFERIHDTQRFSYRCAHIHKREIGKEVVNAITIARLRDEFEHRNLQDEDVAVLSSNDKFIHIYSLTQLQPLKTIGFKVCMNHASISPNGQLLVAVGDHGKVYFYRRTPLLGQSSKGKAEFARHDWVQIAEIGLAITTTYDCCFSTAFSPSGDVCAVASQFGTVTNFRTSLIREDMGDEDAIIDAFRSTRPYYNPQTTDISIESPGAVRSMAFGPYPWDLFAWAEERGTVCVMDVRGTLKGRQILKINIETGLSTQVDLLEIDRYNTDEQRQLELELDASYMQRHRDALDARDHLASVQNAADYLEEITERRRRLRETYNSSRGPSISNPHELTESERDTLESLRLRQLPELGSGGDTAQAPFSIHYTDPAHEAVLVANRQADEARPYQRESLLGRSVERTSSSTSRAFPPRRQSSVVISNSNSNASRSSTTHPSSLAPLSGRTALSTSPSRISSTPSASTPPTRTNRASRSQASATWEDMAAAMSAHPAQSALASLESTSRLRTSQILTDDLSNADVQADPAAPTPPQQAGSQRGTISALDEENQSIDASTSLINDLGAVLGELPTAQSNQIWARAQELMDTLAQERRLNNERREAMQRENLEREREREDRLRRQEREREEREREDRERREARARRTHQLHAARERERREVETRALHSLTDLGLTSELGTRITRAGVTGNTDGIQFLRDLVRMRSENERISRRGAPHNNEPTIMGLGWSSDGRSLFVATEDGILEYRINFADRMSFPAVSLL